MGRKKTTQEKVNESINAYEQSNPLEETENEALQGNDILAEECNLEDCQDCGEQECSKNAESSENSEYAAEVDPEEDVEEDSDDEEDDEFMNSIDEEKKDKPAKRMTPEQVKARKEFLITRNADLNGQMADKQKVTELGKHYGLQILISALEKATCDDVQKHEVKEATKGLKSLDAVLTFKTLVNAYNVSIRRIQDEIARNEKELQNLGPCQLGLLDKPTERKKNMLSQE